MSKRIRGGRKGGVNHYKETASRNHLLAFREAQALRQEIGNSVSSSRRLSSQDAKTRRICRCCCFGRCHFFLMIRDFLQIFFPIFSGSVKLAKKEQVFTVNEEKVRGSDDWSKQQLLSKRHRTRLGNTHRASLTQISYTN